MRQIYDMGPTALLTLRRKACWGFIYIFIYTYIYIYCCVIDWYKLLYYCNTQRDDSYKKNWSVSYIMVPVLLL